MPEAWLIYGWKIGQEALKKAIMGMPPEAMEGESAIRVVVSANGQMAILGKIVAGGPVEDGIADLGFFMTEPYVEERMTKRIEELGLSKIVSGRPQYWFGG